MLTMFNGVTYQKMKLCFPLHLHARIEELCKKEKISYTAAVMKVLDDYFTLIDLKSEFKKL
ncbi:hypothetical protein D9M68_445810 [compost metagenome]